MLQKRSGRKKDTDVRREPTAADFIDEVETLQDTATNHELSNPIVVPSQFPHKTYLRPLDISGCDWEVCST